MPRTPISARSSCSWATRSGWMRRARRAGCTSSSSARRRRSSGRGSKLLMSTEVDLDGHEARTLPTPEEQLLSFDLVSRSAEALQAAAPARAARAVAARAGSQLQRHQRDHGLVVHEGQPLRERGPAQLPRALRGHRVRRGVRALAAGAVGDGRRRGDARAGARAAPAPAQLPGLPRDAAGAAGQHDAAGRAAARAARSSATSGAGDQVVQLALRVYESGRERPARARGQLVDQGAGRDRGVGRRQGRRGRGVGGGGRRRRLRLGRAAHRAVGSAPPRAKIRASFTLGRAAERAAPGGTRGVVQARRGEPARGAAPSRRQAQRVRVRRARRTRRTGPRPSFAASAASARAARFAFAGQRRRVAAPSRPPRPPAKPPRPSSPRADRRRSSRP